MRSLLSCLLLLAAAPESAGAAEPENEAKAQDAPCTSTDECVEREGRGSVCVESQCRPYQDATDLFAAVGLSEKEEKQPEPYKPLLTILPVIGSNPTQGVLAGVAVIVGIYLGDPETTTISNISANILYTTKNQFLSGINSVLMLEQQLLAASGGLAVPDLQPGHLRAGHQGTR